MGAEGEEVFRLAVETGLALLHSLWQGALVAFALGWVLKRVPARRAVLRHNLGCAALVLMLALLVATWTRMEGTPPEGIYALRDGAARPPAVWQTAPAPADPAASTAPARPVVASPSEQARARALWPGWAGLPPAAVQTLRRLAYQAAPWLCLLWVAGLVVMSTRLAFGVWGLGVLKRRAAPLIEAPWPEELRRLRAALGLGRGKVRLLRSEWVQVPMLAGWLRPAILLPASAVTGLSPDHLRLLLAHELAHLRRFDPLIQLVQCVIETLMFYHPAVWWVSRQIRREREHCCDDLAVKVGTSALCYAEALAAMEGLRSAPGWALSAGGGVLLSRIQRLLEPAPVETYRAAGTVVGVAAVLAASGVAWAAHAASLEPFVRFPHELSLGTLYIRDAGVEYDASMAASGFGEGWRAYVPAQGWVEVPEGTELMLRVPPAQGEAVAALAELDADDLRKLDLSDCGLEDGDLEAIGGLTGLTSLNLNGNPITDAGLACLEGMTGLRWLGVERTQVTGADAPVLGKLRALEYFDAYATPFTDAGVARLAALPHLKRLGLEATPVTAEGLRHLGAAAAMEELNLEQTAADDSVVAALAELPRLRTLSVAKTAVTDEGLSALARAQQLEVLNVRYTGVGDAGVEPLRDLPALREVLIEGSAVSQAWHKSFQTAAAERRRATAPPPQSSTHPDAPRVGIVMSHLTATAPNCRGAPWGYVGQDSLTLAALFDESNFDVYAVIEPGTENEGELPSLLDTVRLTQKTVDATDAAALAQLDVVVCKNFHHAWEPVLAALEEAVEQGLGLVTVGPLGDEIPGAEHPAVGRLFGMARPVKYLGPRATAMVRLDHPLLEPAEPGATFTLAMPDGYRSVGAPPEGEVLVGPPEDAPTDFPTIYVHSRGAGCVVHLQWYNLPLGESPFPGKYDIYVRAVNWAAGHPANRRW